MRLNIVLFAATVFIAPSIRAQHLSIHPAKIRDTLLTRILVQGEEVPIANSVMKTYTVYMRLWRVAHIGGCQESETACSYWYYLAVADVGEEEPVTLYSLGEVGEITSLRWLSEKQLGVARLRVTAINWPKSVLETEMKLKHQSRSYGLRISTAAIVVTPIAGHKRPQGGGH
jgi:hypothetical protein